jgi:hypothetical protein
VQAILAPVPCIHIFHALETCAKYGNVAFGTDAVSFFTDEKRNQVFSADTVVLIAASRPERGHGELYKKGYANFRAEFDQWVPADPQGKHLELRLRPPSTVGDGPFFGFWQVKGLHALSNPIPFKNLFADGKDHPITMPPRGPLKVNWHIRPPSDARGMKSADI